MGQPYVGEIRIFGGTFAPAGWSFCDGSTIAISQNPTLFNLIGTTYGGNGTTTFNVPDLRGRVPIHIGSNGTSTYLQGQSGGVEQVVLNSNQLPQHQHTLSASSSAAAQDGPGGALLAAGEEISLYSAAVPNHALDPTALAASVGGQPHDNHQPYLALTFIISLFGVYPSQ